MKKVPKQTRLDYWKYQFAALTFREASKVADYLIDKRFPELQYGLLTSLYALYARPFRQLKDVRISDELVPSEYREVHDYLLILRDKIFVHVDEQAPFEWEKENLSKIWFGYRNGDFRPGFAQKLPAGFQLDKTKALCGILYEICNAKSEEIGLACMEGGALFPPELTYEVDLRDGERFLLRHRRI